MSLKETTLLDKGYKGVTIKTALWTVIGGACGYITPRCSVWLG